MQASELDVINAGLGAAAFVLAGASLAWQSVTWKLSGSRARAELRIGVMHRNSLSRQVLSYPAGKAWGEIAREGAPHGLTRKVLLLKVRSTGRQQVTIESWSAVFPGGPKISQLNSDLGPSLPHTLGAGEPGEWAIELNTLETGRQILEGTRVLRFLWRRRTIRVRLEAELGHGKVIRTSRWHRARLPD
jgi:hypothetical protein